jgi:hypothetical protein
MLIAEPTINPVVTGRLLNGREARMEMADIMIDKKKFSSE